MDQLAPTEPQHIPVVIVGAGQAGLSLSWHLTQAGIDHVLLERSGVAHEWNAGRWDNFTLVTPNWQCRLPGYDHVHAGIWERTRARFGAALVKFKTGELRCW